VFFKPEQALVWLQQSCGEDTKLGLSTRAVVHLANVVTLVRWKQRAGSRCDASTPTTVLEEIQRQRAGVPSAADRQRDEGVAWEGWVQSGILPAVHQGWAVPGLAMRPRNMDKMVLAERRGRLEELRKRRRQIANPLRLEEVVVVG
jgi:hypothetical protein